MAQPIPDPPIPADVPPERAKQHSAYKLYCRGRSFLEIAATLGVDERKALEMCYQEAKDKVILAKLGMEIFGPDHMQFEVNRQIAYLDWIQSKMDAKIERGEVAAAAQALKIVELKAKLLGLMAPERVEHTLTDATPATARAAMQEIFGNTANKVAAQDPPKQPN